MPFLHFQNSNLRPNSPWFSGYLADHPSWGYGKGWLFSQITDGGLIQSRVRLPQKCLLWYLWCEFFMYIRYHKSIIINNGNKYLRQDNGTLPRLGMGSCRGVFPYPPHHSNARGTFMERLHNWEVVRKYSVANYTTCIEVQVRPTHETCMYLAITDGLSNVSHRVLEWHLIFQGQVDTWKWLCANVLCTTIFIEVFTMKTNGNNWEYLSDFIKKWGNF